MKLLIWLLLLPAACFAQGFSSSEIVQFQKQAKKVNIIRDNYGVPHIYGNTDADAVFGLMYAQCEDDFKRIELNYIEKLGRLSEIKGEEELYNDLYVRMIIDSADAMKDYQQCEAWLKKLLDAWAAGINYYLVKHPEVKPCLLHRFEPWYPLLWTDGSIGAINTGDVTEDDVKRLFTGEDVGYHAKQLDFDKMNTGSNGFAIAPSRSASGNSLLYINPHVTFYFRPEVQMSSDEGLQVYGAVTWGQFFIYQGFNEKCGWMHTSSNVDVADNYREKTLLRDGKLYYEYEKELKPVTYKTIGIAVKKGKFNQVKNFDVMYTGHGPIMARWDGSYISVKSMNRSITSLKQSWLRTKATGLKDFEEVMQLCANTSNNTVFADNNGNIAYWHGNFVPQRDTALNWGKPVDGSIAATEWKDLHPLQEIVQVINPASGFIQNCNSTPYTVAGSNSPKANKFPRYMAPDGENFRGLLAAELLSECKQMDIDRLITLGYDTRLTAFEILVPALISKYQQLLKTGDSTFYHLQETINELAKWNYKCDTNSVAATLAIEWAERLPASIKKVYINEGEISQVDATRAFAAKAPATELLAAMDRTVSDLQKRFRTWRIAWGAINRFQRVSADMVQPFADSLPSRSIGFTSAVWGCLPAYVSRYFNGSNKRYGVSGNSFISSVEFGKRVKAKSLLAGGESGNPQSPHFKDQLENYTKGVFKEVWFYPEDVQLHAERTYHPGE